MGCLVRSFEDVIIFEVDGSIALQNKKHPETDGLKMVICTLVVELMIVHSHVLRQDFEIDALDLLETSYDTVRLLTGFNKKIQLGECPFSTSMHFEWP